MRYLKQKIIFFLKKVVPLLIFNNSCSYSGVYAVCFSATFAVDLMNTFKFNCK